VQASRGLLVIPGIEVSNSRFYHGKKNKGEIYKQLDEQMDKYYPLYGIFSQSSFHALGVFSLCTIVIKEAVKMAAGIILEKA